MSSAKILYYMVPIIAAMLLFTMIRIVFISQDTSLDLYLLNFIKPFINSTNTIIMVCFTTLGNHDVVLTGNILLFLFLFAIKKEHWLAIKIGITALGALLLMYILKDFFQRPRPLVPLLDPARGFSFPSGHSLNSLVFYGLIIYVSTLYIKNKVLMWLTNVVLSLTILLIGISRIYINVHYPSDVIAGFSVGAIWLFLCFEIMKYLKKISWYK